jgi:hypothetical protein
MIRAELFPVLIDINNFSVVVGIPQSGTELVVIYYVLFVLRSFLGNEHLKNSEMSFRSRLGGGEIFSNF